MPFGATPAAKKPKLGVTTRTTAIPQAPPLGDWQGLSNWTQTATLAGLGETEHGWPDHWPSPCRLSGLSSRPSPRVRNGLEYLLPIEGQQGGQMDSSVAQHSSMASRSASNGPLSSLAGEPSGRRYRQHRGVEADGL